MSIKDQLNRELQGIIKKMGGDFVPVVEIPSDLSHGDFTTNAAMVLGKKLKRNPMEVAQEIKDQISKIKTEDKNSKLYYIEKIDVVRPGFVNFWLGEEFLYSEVDRLMGLDRVQVKSDLTGKKILVEYAHPNTHKEMHIGHMRTLITGEAVSRLLEAGGAKVFRANYQGDIGPHVAKAMVGIQKIIRDEHLDFDTVRTWNDKDRAHFLGRGYVEGNNLYDSGEWKEEIDKMNAFLYQKIAGITPEASFTNEEQEKIWNLYQETRQWSLDYYDYFYKRFYTKFDRLFFESEMTEGGKDLVLKHLGDIFKKDNGAIIFEGEKYGFHTRVFISSQGNPLYEAKDMWNAYKQYEAFPFDLNIHVVANEQKGYFDVVIKALELIDPNKFKGAEYHLSMGMVQLKDRKISSRTGDILTVDWLIDEVKDRVVKLVDEQKVSSGDFYDVTEKITIGAIKYSVLRVGTEQDVAFDIAKSVSLEGNSGPYLQYSYVRTQSVLDKAGKEGLRIDENLKFESPSLQLGMEELELLRLLVRFEDVVRLASERYAPGVLCQYLFVLAQAFNLFYQKLPILQAEEGVREFRLGLTGATGNVLQKGLGLLGIAAPERM